MDEGIRIGTVVVLPDVVDSARPLKEGEEDNLWRQCCRMALMSLWCPPEKPELKGE